MKKKYLEAGKIVNTHGVRGEVKIQPWCDSADDFTEFHTVYIDGKPFKILRSRVQKTSVIAAIEGIDTLDGAIALKNKIVFIDRDDVELEDGSVFIKDLIGLNVINNTDGGRLGVLADVLTLPANDVYVVKKDDGSELLLPAVGEFILEKNIDGGFVRVRLIEGL